MATSASKRGGSTSSNIENNQVMMTRTNRKTPKKIAETRSSKKQKVEEKKHPRRITTRDASFRILLFLASIDVASTKTKQKQKKNLSTCPKIMRVVGRGFVVCVVVALPSPSFPQSSGSSQSRPTIDRPDIRSTHGDLERSRSSLPDAATACGICGFLPSLRLSLRCPPPVIIG